ADMVFESTADIPPADFSGAHFTINTLELVNVNVGAPVPGPVPKGVTGTVHASSLFTLTAKSGVILSTTIIQNLDGDLTKQAGLGVGLFEFTGVHGFLFPAGIARDKDPPPDTVDSITTPSPRQARGIVPIQFKLDSSEILPGERQLLERRLAIHRAFFEALGKSVMVYGYAS